MTKQDVIRFTNKVSAAIDRISTIYITVMFNEPVKHDNLWNVKGLIIGEKGEEYTIKASIYDFKGQFSLIKEGELAAKTPWISYNDRNLEEHFESWNDIICPNPFEYYEL